MNKILALWATPRSTSIAFEWMMHMRGDMACFHGLFGEWWYGGQDAEWSRLSEDSPHKLMLTFNSVWPTLHHSAEKQAVFSKDFPHYIKNYWTDEFLSHFNHSLLIRDLAKLLNSLYKHCPEFTIGETAIAEQRQLFDRLGNQLGHPPPLIDSDDLLENPSGIVEAWYQAVDINYIPEALSWKPGDRNEVSWYDNGSWHTNLRNLDGLKKKEIKNININKLSDKIKVTNDSLLKDYQHMHPHCLRAA